MIQFVKDYRENGVLRASFNQLAFKTFGIQFEDWYQLGYWGENYSPYSMIEGNRVVANVSVNKMDFLWEGELRHFFQLGTIMTDEPYRNQGLSRRLMEQVLAEYEKQSEGIYLFANDSVLDFYPKFGFYQQKEYQYSGIVNTNIGREVFAVNMMNIGERKKLQKAIQGTTGNGAFEMRNNPELVFFYVTSFMKENVYFWERENAYIIAETEGDKLYLYAVYSEKEVSATSVIQAFGKEIKEVVFMYTPKEKNQYMKSQVQEEDTTLFVLGKGMIDFERYGIMFPAISHA